MDGLDIAIHQSAHADLPELAKSMGLNEQSLRNKVCPTNEVAKLSVQEWRSMMLITRDVQSLRVMASDLGMQLVSQEVKQASVFDALLSFNKEQGDVAFSIQVAFKDNHLSDRECAQVRREINEARNALDVLEQSIQGQVGKQL
ncbi:phage regulatory CII family protein [Psychromonas sp. 14N.309.X.WAT.B.A12]|uniref:phage regulatory CII family protein n=1 Tax=Psychromonas sp. 14N.309.X.WAT.B.A12 TaxID=2998322 RepID=UPI0025B03141|nr:phage regulatory CII family protein [Psychromonas sp. 14N.309.X.WAT.B.A12]MDN2661822.1 phage regulatory CII family protein [Psychromonas sp. 14N.309.X.WAT.B.A12]